MSEFGDGRRAQEVAGLDAQRQQDTIAAAREVVAQARRALSSLGADVTPRHSLFQQIKAIEWLADVGLRRNFEGGLTGEEADRIWDSVLTLGRLSQLTPALQGFAAVKGNREHVHWLRGDLDSFDKEGNEALDHLLEIEVAGLLARYPHISVEMAEPDVVFESRGERTLIACKRPKTLNGIDGALRKASRQIQRQGVDGIALIDVSLMLLPRDTDAFNFPTLAHADSAFRGRLDDTLRAAPSRLNTALEKDVVAVLYTGIVVFTDEEASQVRARRVSQLVWNPEAPASEARVRRLDRLLR
jgi:hypothetical protein